MGGQHYNLSLLPLVVLTAVVVQSAATVWTIEDGGASTENNDWMIEDGGVSTENIKKYNYNKSLLKQVEAATKCTNAGLMLILPRSKAEILEIITYFPHNFRDYNARQGWKYGIYTGYQEYDLPRNSSLWMVGQPKIRPYKYVCVAINLVNKGLMTTRCNHQVPVVCQKRVEYSIGVGKKTYKDAKSACESKGMTLVMALTREQGADLLEFVAQHEEELKLPVGYSTWIGLDDLAEPGTWKWNDGSPYNDETLPGLNETDQCVKRHCCGHIYGERGSGQVARMASCEFVLSYVCQPVWMSELGGASTRNKYTYNKSLLHQDEAVTKCKNAGLMLILPRSQAEIEEIIRAVPHYTDPKARQSYRYGLYTGYQENDVPRNSSLWMKGQPKRKNYKTCVSINMGNKGLMVTRCTNQVPVVCQKQGVGVVCGEITLTHAGLLYDPLGLANASSLESVGLIWRWVKIVKFTEITDVTLVRAVAGNCRNPTYGYMPVLPYGINRGGIYIEGGCQAVLKVCGKLPIYTTVKFHVYTDTKYHGDAAKKCKDDGYTLAMPKTLELQQEMVKQIRSATQGKDWRIWIGFTGSQNGGFTWSDGEAVGWTNWWTGNGGQPNSGSHHACGEIATSASCAWNDNECNVSKRFVCQEVLPRPG